MIWNVLVLVLPPRWPLLRRAGWRRSVPGPSCSCSWSVTGAGLLASAGGAGVRAVPAGVRGLDGEHLGGAGAAQHLQDGLLRAHQHRAAASAMTIRAAVIRVCAVAGSRERRFVTSMAR